MNTEVSHVAGQKPQVWTHRFWTRVQNRTGMSIHGVLKVVPFSGVEQCIQGFKDDPESAADAQIAKWKVKYPLVDQAFRD